MPHKKRKDTRFPAFNPVWKTRFVERPNRFLVRCESEELGAVDAFMPNPGRLWELLFPGAPIYLTAAASRSNAPRKTRFTVIGVERDGAPVFLHTHLNNAVAAHLIDNRTIPGLKRAKRIGTEVAHGRSRFDFLLEEGGDRFYLEVKSVTLFGNGVAMFPDAVTERGRRHLLELAELGVGGRKHVVLFQAHSARLDYFMPDYHTDFAFSRTLLEVRNAVRIVPVALEWREGLRLGAEVKKLRIPWRFLEREMVDRGTVIVQCRFKRSKGRFKAGHYLSVFDVAGEMSRVAARLQRRAGLGPDSADEAIRHADDIVVMPVRSSKPKVERIAEGLAGCMESVEEHVFYFRPAPLESRAFHRVLQDARMVRPE